MTEQEYKNHVRIALMGKYNQVEESWYPFRGHGHEMYSPVVDIAVGPFAIERRYEQKYSELLTETRDFVVSLIDAHNHNVEDQEECTSFESIAYFNQNARCFLCIEIEESGGRKHCLGNLVNASALGRIGILVARNEEILDVFLRQRVYLRYLAEAGKNTFKTDNALVLSEAQFNSCLSQTQR